ncbi:MAG: acetate--CoA ligase [Hadesarchaea archaeon]|nr:acetate--CoA ligase [Hadesarchaea archaeon]
MLTTNIRHGENVTDEEVSTEEELIPPRLKEMIRKGKENPEELWGEIAKELNWFQKWNKVYEEEKPGKFQWFKGGKTNISYNCLDHNIERGLGNKAALIYETGEKDVTRVLTYNQLLYKVKEFASTLRAFGIEKGDRITIYMPQSPEAVIAMLACSRIGAIHSVVFAGFGAGALADRIELAESKLLLTADVGFRKGKTIDLKAIVDKALDEHEKANELIEKLILLKRGEEEVNMKEGRDIFWKDALKKGEDENSNHVVMDAMEPAFILPTSGTTGRPKGTVHTHGGYQVHIYAMAKWVFGLGPEDTWWSTSDIGWIVGHSYIVYAPLLTGATTIIFEGTPIYPDPGIWWKTIEKNKVTKVFTAPTAIRALSKYPAEHYEKHDLSSLKAVFSAGEPLNPSAWKWLQKKVLNDRVPVIDHMWQTESAGPLIGNPYGISLIPIKPGSAGISLPGIDTEIVDRDGNPLEPGKEGILIIKKPFPGLTPTLWEGEDRYIREYWSDIPGAYYVGDAADKDEDGYIWFSGRADEVLTIAGHRIGPTDIEDALVSHDAVVEAAIVGKPDPEKTEVATAFVVLTGDQDPTEELKKDLIKRVREEVGPIAIIGDLVFVDQLPKTRSGKIMRRTIKDIMMDRELGDISTMEDQSAVEEIDEACEQIEVEE